MRLKTMVFVGMAAVIAACVDQDLADDGGSFEPIQQVASGPKLSTRQALNNYNTVVARLEPVAEQICRQRAPNLNCDFRIFIDETPASSPNAYQTLNSSGRPLIGFNVPLIAEARNQNEIAFVLAHEAAHHIEGHIARQQNNAVIGGLLGGLAAAAAGVSVEGVDTLQQVGATVGARTYSKAFELEADATGTRIAHAAGYDPVQGAQFFFRIPDPGDKFLGTHPANADRLRTVQRVAAGL